MTIKKINFLTEDSLVDVDGNKYEIVKIGNQTWMAENLRTTRFLNGDEIAHIESDSRWGKSKYKTWSWSQWKSEKKSAWSWYKNEQTNDTIYGKLYNSVAVKDKRCLCPAGWHLPSRKDFDILIENVKFTYKARNASKLMKSKSGWKREFNGNNRSGFSAVASGFRSYLYNDKRPRYKSGRLYNPNHKEMSSSFVYEKHFAVWWTNNNNFFVLSFKKGAKPSRISSSDPIIGGFTRGFSVRCIKK